MNYVTRYVTKMMTHLKTMTNGVFQSRGPKYGDHSERVPHMSLTYRISDPDDYDCDDEDEEFDAMRDYIGVLMDRTGPNDVIDSMLIIANLCEARSLLYPPNSPAGLWYRRTSAVMRDTLQTLSSDIAAPNYKLENPLLYYPEPDKLH